jgi:hypothetical protein
MARIQVLPPKPKAAGEERGGCSLELTHQGDDERKDVQQPVQDLGRAFGLFPEDPVNQQGLQEGEGECECVSGTGQAARRRALARH